MARFRKSGPTDAELEILQVLWERGASTVREVFDVLAQSGKQTGYTTVLKFLQIMFEKGFVTRDESERSHRYSAKLKQQVTQRALVRNLLDKAFGGATEQLVLQALNARKVTPGELAEIRRLLDDYEQKSTH